MSEKISTLIIDMYGVIIKERTGNFVPYTFEHFDQSQHSHIQKLLEEERLFSKAGLGELSSHEFLSLLGYDDAEYHMKNYIENYLSLDSSFIPFAEKYHDLYDFVLLSTDVSEWSQYITEYYGLKKYFKHRIVSGDVHCRKPDRRIYRIALDQVKKYGSQCLFVDDNVNNILAAKELGIHTVLFNRFREPYAGDSVLSFEELDVFLQNH